MNLVPLPNQGKYTFADIILVLTGSGALVILSFLDSALALPLGILSLAIIAAGVIDIVGMMS